MLKHKTALFSSTLRSKMRAITVTLSSASASASSSVLLVVAVALLLLSLSSFLLLLSSASASASASPLQILVKVFDQPRFKPYNSTLDAYITLKLYHNHSTLLVNKET